MDLKLDGLKGLSFGELDGKYLKVPKSKHHVQYAHSEVKTSKLSLVKAKVANAVKPAFVATSLAFIKVARWYESAIRGLSHKKVTPILAPTQGLAAISFILHVRNVALHALGMAKVAAKEKIEKALLIISSIGSMLDSMAGFASFLNVMKVFKPFAWLTPVFAASFVIESASVPINIRRFNEARQFSKDLKQHIKNDGEFTIDDYRKGVSLIKNEQQAARDKKLTSLTKKFVHGKEDDLNAHLHRIEIDAEMKIEEGKTRIAEGYKIEGQALIREANESMRGALKALNKRVTAGKWSQALNVLITAVSGVGLAILLFSPLAPLGYAILATVTVASLAEKLVYQRRVEKAFKRAIMEPS